MLGGFAATAADANSSLMDEIAARCDDFERSMRWYMGVDDPKEAGVVAGLGVHLSEVGVLLGKAAEEDAAAEEGHHGRIVVAIAESKTVTQAGAVTAVAADANTAGSTRRASKREAAAAATDAINSTINSKGGGPAAATASKNAKDASDAAREHAKRAREASNAAVAASNWGTGTGTGTKSRRPPGTKSGHPPGTTSDGSPPTGQIEDGGADGSMDDASPGRKTRACHQCARRHVPRYECKNKTASNPKGGRSGGVTCGASYCDGCARRHYPRWYRDGETMHLRCPKCSGACVCRACLRDPIPPPAIADAIPPHRLRGLYEDLVASCAHALKITAERETSEMAADAECAATRDSHEDALDASSTRGWRLFCDQCGGAVANLHRSCWACEVDLCVECCSDLRCGVGVGSPGWKNAGGAPAATPASALVGAGKGGVSHAGSHNKRTRDQIEHPSTDDSKPAGERPSETTLAALPVKKRLKLAATRTDSGTVVSKPDVSNAGFGRSSELIKIEPPDASVKVEVGVESSPCAEPLLCVRCTRPMELRSCVERKWLDRIYKSSRYLRAVEKLEKERKKLDVEVGVVATTTGKSGVLSMKASDDERCPWCSALPVGSSELRDCGAGGSVWCPSARDLRADAGADAGADGGADVVGEEPGTTPVARATPTDPDALRHFRWHWARGEPVVVREIEVDAAGADWSLETLERALRDGGAEGAEGADDTTGGDAAGGATRTSRTDRMVPVVDASKEWGAGVRSSAVAEAMTVGDFFKGFADARAFGPDATYRMDGWPSEAELRVRAPRHVSYAIGGLPFQEYTNPVDGPMNLRTHVSANAGGLNGDGASFGAGGGCVRTRIAYGRREEVGGAGDAVSQRLRTSSVDTAEVLCLALERDAGERDTHAEGRDGSCPDGGFQTGDESPGAVWHVFRREHEGHIARYLSENLPVLAHPPDGDRRNHHNREHRDSANDKRRALAARLPLHDGRCFLSSNEIDELGRESGGAVKPWVIRQARGEAVMVPTGCARQTRNVKSCVSLAVDFASPESAVAALRVGESMRELPVTHAERTRGEGVHARTTVLHAAHAAVTRLEAGDEAGSIR